MTNIQYSDPLLGLNGISASQDVGAVEFLIVPYTVPLTASPGELIENTAIVSSAQIDQQRATASVRVVEPPLSILPARRHRSALYRPFEHHYH
ncbi:MULTISPECIES: hypothetical protein [Paenibacillus]|uniref:hypothetical protein n=1 Tax=Paenibacillus TaxID=44249 RepID=UPI00128E245E|nr:MULTISPECIES: hypothetical protein [Paenibacillus]MPY20292.1 hypothetical protein [Paenibacillus glucanolyticus]